MTQNSCCRHYYIDGAKAELLIHLFARELFLMEKLEIEKN